MSAATHSAETPKAPLGAGSARWIAAIVIAALIHGGAVWLVLRSKSEEAPPSEPPPAVMIDLAPVVPAAETPTPDVATGPQMTEAEPPPSAAATEAPKPVEAMSPSPRLDTQEGVAPEAQPELPPPESPKAEVQPANPPPTSEPQPQSDAPAPPKIETPSALLSEVETPPPRGHAKMESAPRPSAAKVKAPKPQPILDKTMAQEKVPDNRRTSAPSAASAAARPQTAAAPASSAGQSAAVLASWKGQLIAHINRFKRFPDRALAGGTSTVTFTIDRSGRVASAGLAGWSGDPLLDKEAVDLLFRASPVPAPPAGLVAGTITLRVPIKFNR